jgi:hypothetical protein
MQSGVVEALIRNGITKDELVKMSTLPDILLSSIENRIINDRMPSALSHVNFALAGLANVLGTDAADLTYETKLSVVRGAFDSIPPSVNAELGAFMDTYNRTCMLLDPVARLNAQLPFSNLKIEDVQESMKHAFIVRYTELIERYSRGAERIAINNRKRESTVAISRVLEPEATYKEPIIRMVVARDDVVTGSIANDSKIIINKMVADFAVGSADQLTNDVNKAIEYISGADFSSGNIAGIKVLHEKIMVDGKKCTMYQAKPSDIPGMSSRVPKFRSVRISFALGPEGEVVIISVLDRKDVKTSVKNRK